MAKSHLKLITPPTVNRTVTPKRVPNADLRTREYLTEAEVERLLTAANGTVAQFSASILRVFCPPPSSAKRGIPFFCTPRGPNKGRTSYPP